MRTTQSGRTLTAGEIGDRELDEVSPVKTPVSGVQGLGLGDHRTFPLNDGLKLSVVLTKDGKHVTYGFVTHQSTNVVSTNDPNQEINKAGVHWCWRTPYGLWVQGNPIAFSEGLKVVAILPNHKVVPLQLTDEEVDELLEGGLDMDQSRLWKEHISPLFQGQEGN